MTTGFDFGLEKKEKLYPEGTREEKIEWLAGWLAVFQTLKVAFQAIWMVSRPSG